MSQPTIVEFDLDRYLRNSKKVDLSGIDWDADPGPPALRRRRDVPPLHDGHRDAHGDLPARPARHPRRGRPADHRLPRAAGSTRSSGTARRSRTSCAPTGSRCRPSRSCPTARTPMPTRPNRWRDLRVKLGVGNGLGIVPTMLGSMMTRDFAAIHMMWGAVNELTTLTGYHALIRRCDHPVLHQLLRKVIQDERRHFAFYRAQAKARMQRTPHRPPAGPLGARAPLDAGRRGRQDRGGGRRAGASTCSATAPRAASRSARSTARSPDVPGLEGLTLLEDYLDAALAPGGRAPRLGRDQSRGPAPRDQRRPPPAPTHWRESEDGRPDVMPATSEVERREERRMAERLQ